MVLRRRVGGLEGGGLREHRTSNVQHRMMNRQIYDLEERLLEYAARIINIVEQLPKGKAGNHVSGQLIRSGTSPYPNHGEAQAAESQKDFIHNFRICLKELRETQRWIKLIQRVPLIRKPELLNDLLKETEELIKILLPALKQLRKIRSNLRFLSYR
jgi:four helix bundle protein